MPQPTTKNLSTIAENDPVSGPIARLHLVAIDALEDPALTPHVDQPRGGAGSAGRPLIHGETLAIDVKAARRLLKSLHAELASVLDDSDTPAGGNIDDVDPLALLAASLTFDHGRLNQLTDRTGMDAAALATVAHVASMPVLHAFRKQTEASPDGENGWESGNCPVCGAWPLLVELRGLERQKWARCGRCAAEWRTRHLQCVYCDNTDHKTLGYFAGEAERESRRALTCDKCRGFIKAFATVSALSLAEVLQHDLSSVELDVATMENGYGRPEHLPYPIDVNLEPKRTNGRKLLPWR